MKRILTVSLTLLCLSNPARGEVAADYAEGERSAELVTQEAAAAATAMLGAQKGAELLHALRLQMTKYDLDMTTDAGRRAWHGRLIAEEIHTNELVKVSVYSNTVSGAVWRYRQPFKPRTLRTPAAAAVDVRGIPQRLAAARRAAASVAGVPVSNVVVEVIGNAPKPEVVGQ